MNGMIDLQAPMPDGAPISDWLGTAYVAATGAAIYLDRVRTRQSTNDIASLLSAQLELEQAAEEIVTILRRVGWEV